MKHILPLTYEPKIPDVLNGKCTQTIRPISYTKPKNKGDLVMFHGWEGTPYYSKWSFRTPYWKIIDSFDMFFRTHKEGVIIRKADEYTNFSTLSRNEVDKIAKLDGFNTIEEMINDILPSD